MDGIALAHGDIPSELIERVNPLVHARGGEQEVRFLRRAKVPLLSIWHCGNFVWFRGDADWDDFPEAV